MFNRLLSQIFKFFGVFFRTIHAFILRQVRSITSRVRQLRNLPRSAAQVAVSTVQTAADVTQKPTKREDYIKIGRLLISKAFLLRLVLGLVIAGVLIWYVIWPFILSHFLTARFYVEDKRVRDWTGRAIVYSDKKKTVPLYEGKLEEGVLQGQGKRYDEGGLLQYEGQFLSGLPSGTGREYTEGVLNYEGQFAGGLYEGAGTLYQDGLTAYEGQFSKGKYDGRGNLYENGVLTYSGQFSEGKYDGRGDLYDGGGIPLYSGQFSEGKYDGRGTAYEDGERVYEGNFSDSVPEGNGTAYRAGVKRYEGEFAKGVPSGTGKEYDETGRLLYEGSWEEGVYNGQGSLYPVQGHRLDAQFEDGAPEGVVRWSKGGKLYYEGGWEDGAPEGFGTLYNQAGQPIYAGFFRDGTLDGGWLLTQTADALREVLGADKAASAREDDKNYLIRSEALGLTARCNFRTEDEDSGVQEVYLFTPKDNGWVRLLPGMDNVSDTLWEPGNGAWEQSLKISTLPANSAVGNGTYACQGGYVSGGAVTVLRRDSWGEAVAAIWVRAAVPLAVPDAKSSAVSPEEKKKSEKKTDPKEDAEKVQEFLDALDELEEAAGAGLDEENEYLGDKSPEPALKAAKTPELTGMLAEALIDYWVWAEKQSSYEEALARTETLLSEAKDALNMGKGSADAVTEQETEKLRLSGLIEQCMTGRKQAELQAQKIVTGSPGDYDLSQLLLLFDPSELEIDDLTPIALAWAQANNTPAGEEETVLAVKDLLLSLTDGWTSINNLRAQFESAAETVQTAAGNYAMGTGEKQAWYHALSARAEVQLALYEALANYMKLANTLNQLTGGWVSRTYDWYEEAFDFALPEPEEEPQPVSEEEAETEAEAGTETEAEPEAEASSGADTQAAPESQGTSAPSGAQSPETAGTAALQDAASGDALPQTEQTQPAGQAEPAESPPCSAEGRISFPPAESEEEIHTVFIPQLPQQA